MNDERLRVASDTSKTDEGKNPARASHVDTVKKGESIEEAALFVESTFEDHIGTRGILIV